MKRGAGSATVVRSERDGGWENASVGAKDDAVARTMLR
jgi:hypothetical protein